MIEISAVKAVDNIHAFLYLFLLETAYKIVDIAALTAIITDTVVTSELILSMKSRSSKLVPQLSSYTFLNWSKKAWSTSYTVLGFTPN